MKILVLGDSSSFGAELSDLPTKYFGPHGNDYVDANGQPRISPPSQRAWPSLLAQRLGCEVSNQSLIGGSNDRIFRLAMEQTLLDQWDLVICAWTSVDRFDFALEKRDLALSVKSHFSFDWIKQFIALHYTSERADANFVTKLIALQSYFAYKKQPYLFVKSFEIILCQQAVELEKHLDRTFCVDWSNDFYKWTKSDPKGPDGHMLEQGHMRIANIMYQHITNMSLIRRDV